MSVASAVLSSRLRIALRACSVAGLLTGSALAAPLPARPATVGPSLRPQSPQPSQPRGPLTDKLSKLISDGQAALSAQDFPKAQSLFEQAFRLKPTPDLLLLLGKVADGQGQSIVAADLYHRYLEAGSLGSDDESVESLRKKVNAVPSSVSEVTVSGLGGSFLLVDGRLLGSLPLNRPLLLSPGPHRYRLEAKGTSWESDPLTVPDGRNAELHLTAGGAGSLIAVMTINSLAILSLDASGLSDDQKKLVEQSISTVAHSEHTILMPPEKVAALLANEPSTCLASTPCLDRLAQKSDVRFELMYTVKAQGSPLQVTIRAALFDVASGLFAAQLEDTFAVDALLASTSTLTRKLFQQAIGHPRGSLLIESSPPQAKVTVDGRVLGYTPLERVTLSGPHQVTLELFDHEPYHATLSVAQGAVAQLSAQLQPKAKPVPPPPPVLVTLPGESSRSRSLRWIFGGISLVSGITVAGLGASALSQNGSCGDRPAPQNGAPCELLYDTRAIGGGLIGAGIGLAVGGSLILFWPGRKPRQVAQVAQPVP